MPDDEMDEEEYPTSQFAYMMSSIIAETYSIIKAPPPAASGGPPGPPPRPGLQWNPQSHRWTRPENAMGIPETQWPEVEEREYNVLDPRNMDSMWSELHSMRDVSDLDGLEEFIHELEGFGLHEPYANTKEQALYYDAVEARDEAREMEENIRYPYREDEPEYDWDWQDPHSDEPVPQGTEEGREASRVADASAWREREARDPYKRSIVDRAISDTYMILKQAPPGPPPRPGLQWDPQRHRWIKPGSDSGGDTGDLPDAHRTEGDMLADEFEYKSIEHIRSLAGL